MSFTLVTSYAIIRSAGAHADSIAIASAALIQDIADKAESQVCEACDYDFITNIDSVAANLKPVIAKAVASCAGAELIAYNPNNYTNLEGQLMLDNLNNQYEKIIGSLKNRQKKYNKFGE